MGMTKKEKWVHILNQEVEELSNRSLSQTIRENANNTREELYKALEKREKPTIKNIKEIIKRNELDKKVLEKVAVNNFITSQVNILMFHRTVLDLKYGLTIKSIIDKSPKKTAENINFISNQITRGSGNVSNIKLQFGYVRLKEIVTKQEFKQIKELVNSYNDRYKLFIKDSIKNELGQINKKLNKRGLDLTNIDTKTITDIDDKKLIKEVKKKFTKKTTKQIKNISGNLIHQNLEENKLNNAKINNFKYKTWVTQGDDRVRFTHRKVNNTKIPINQQFKVGNSKGLYPQDTNMELKEIINCRCYLKYTM